MNKQVKVAALNANILKLAEQISKAVELEANEILEDAENVVKEFIPARKVASVLTIMEKKLDHEGIEVLFDKSVTRTALKKTAEDEVTDKEIEEFIEEIVEAVVEELEDILEDTDDVMDEETDKLTKETNYEDHCEIEAKLKGVLERKLHAKGIYSKFARTASPKRSIADKIRAARSAKKK